MTLAAGSRVGPYEIQALIGAGGMGEVYRARDSKLHRAVALKVLPDLWANDPDRLARFQREAEVLASLNHPYIASIYGLEEAGGVHALVLELVDGPTLADRLAQSSGLIAQGLPLDETLSIAKQIAEALEAAHAHGVVHRDHKPANIKLRPDGTVKVLDFGLAKALEPTRGHVGGGAGSNDPDYMAPSQSPTLASPAATGVGVILGTAAYMAPEQAKGNAADARSDIWSFGVVLYEMLAGKSAFIGDTTIEVLGGVVKTDPDWAALPTTTPSSIRKLIRRCLQKDRNRRLRDIADARFQIEEALEEPISHVAVARSLGTRERLLWITALFVGVIATWILTRPSVRDVPVGAPEARFQIVTPPAPAGALTQWAISPDGRQVVFSATTEGKTQLWLRRFESEKAEPIAGTDGARYPFWSPDNRSIGFFADQKVKRIGISGGNAQTLADGGGDNTTTYGGTWNADGTILFGRSNITPIYRVPASGGQAVEATRVESPRQIGHRFPHFLPDGRHFLFFATGTPGVQGVYLGTLDTTDARRLLESDTAAVFALPGYVLFVRQDTLFAQRLDLDRMEPVGDPFPVTERVVTFTSNFASVALSASVAGPFGYRAAAPEFRQLTWFDRTGKQIGTLGDPDAAELGEGGLRLALDGRAVAVARRVAGNTDVWLMDTKQGLPRRFTFDPATDQNPLWSSDGSRIVFQSSRRGGGFYDLYQKSVAGGGESLLLESSENKNTLDWSQDGRFVLYANLSPETARDLWALPLGGDRKPFAVVQTGFEEAGGRFSPDGRWIAYVSNESGQSEVYVQPFPEPGRSWRISSGGGASPQWRGDGREIFYQAQSGTLMAVGVTLPTDGTSVDAGRPVALFPLPAGSVYAAASDGQRFLVNATLGNVATPPITIVLNWNHQF